MKKKLMIGLAAMALATGVAAIVANNSKLIETKAGGNWGANSGYVAGNWDGTNWSFKKLDYNSAKDRYETTVTVNAGVNFKFTQYNNWDSGEQIARDWAGITGSKIWDLATYSSGGNDKNFVFRYGGTYTLYIDAELLNTVVADASYHCHIELDSYVYYLSQEKNANTNAHIYSWGTNEFYNGFPGTDLDDVAERLDTLTFSSISQYIYRIPINSSVTTGFKFAVNSEDQGTDYSFISHGAYYWDWDGDGWSGAASSMGPALDFLFEAEELRTAISGDMAGSICQISTGRMKSLIDAYEAITDDSVKGYIDAATVSTFPTGQISTSETAKTSVSYGDIMEEIIDYYPRKLAAEQNGGNAFVIAGGEHNNTGSVITIAAIAAFATLTGIGLIAYRKRKSN